MRWFFKRAWCPIFGHSKKTVKMPMFESWSWLLPDKSYSTVGSLHCARCGAMVGEYGVKR
jgi:hypothetical protein